MLCSTDVLELNHQTLALEQQAVEKMSFIYLGSRLSLGLCAGPKVDLRLSSASRAFGALQCVVNG